MPSGHGCCVGGFVAGFLPHGDFPPAFGELFGHFLAFLPFLGLFASPPLPLPQFGAEAVLPAGELFGQGFPLPLPLSSPPLPVATAEPPPTAMKNDVARTVRIGLRITGTQKRSSQKTTFCIIDTTRLGDSTLVPAGNQTYTRCGQNDMTGLTVGWGDRYGWDLAGQEIDLNGLPDGYYWLVSTADFQQRLIETDETNNCAAAKIEIRGTSVYDRGQKIPC